MQIWKYREALSHRADKHPWSCGGRGSLWFPCSGRWAARDPNEKWLPNKANRAGKGTAGGWWCAQLEGGKGEAERGWERENGRAKINAKCSCSA